MEPTYIITASVRLFTGAEPAPGSVMQWCGMCGDAVYLSRVGKIHVDAGAIPLCEQCGIGIVAQNEAVLEPADPTIPAPKNARAFQFIRAAAKAQRER